MSAGMKKFILFRGDKHYPIGGWDDYVGSFASLEEAVYHAENVFDDGDQEKVFAMKYGWYHIVDIETGLKVKEQ